MRVGRRLLLAVAAAAASGAAAGAAARWLLWSHVEAGRAEHPLPGGLAHYLAGVAAVVASQFSAGATLLIASLFAGYELGEWALGDNPSTEMKHFLLGALAASAALGAVKGLTLLAKRKR